MCIQCHIQWQYLCQIHPEVYWSLPKDTWLWVHTWAWEQRNSCQSTHSSPLCIISHRVRRKPCQHTARKMPASINICHICLRWSGPAFFQWSIQTVMDADPSVTSLGSLSSAHPSSEGPELSMPPSIVAACEWWQVRKDGIAVRLHTSGGWPSWPFLALTSYWNTSTSCGDSHMPVLVVQLSVCGVYSFVTDGSTRCKDKLPSIATCLEMVSLGSACSRYSHAAHELHMRQSRVSWPSAWLTWHCTCRRISM